jgi:hypothetical protein
MIGEMWLTGFYRTLQKILIFVNAQQGSSKIKHFFRQSEMNTLLKDCRYGLDQALEAFKVSAVQQINTSQLRRCRLKLGPYTLTALMK